MKQLREIFDVRACGFLFGLILATAGIAMLSIPAALIVPGAALVGLAVWGVR